MTKYEIIEFVWFDHPSNINVIHITGEAVSFMAIVVNEHFLRSADDL